MRKIKEVRGKEGKNSDGTGPSPQGATHLIKVAGREEGEKSKKEGGGRGLTDNKKKKKGRRDRKKV